MFDLMGMSVEEKAASILKSIKLTGGADHKWKMEQLHQLKMLLFSLDLSALQDFLPSFLDLHTDSSSPTRKLFAQTIGEIASKHMELLPVIVPILITLLNDDIPAVVRQAITSGTNLFQHILKMVVIMALNSCELNDLVKSTWACMQKFKDVVYPLMLQHGNNGVKLQVVKFVEVVVLLYTPNPDGSLQPLQESIDGKTMGFDISRLSGRKAILNSGDLTSEGGRSLNLLLDQLRVSSEKFTCNSIIIALINSLLSIAKKRPAFYGRILPVLLGLDPSVCVIHGVNGAYHALKNALLVCLKCTYPSAIPWRNRLVDALKSMNQGDLAEKTLHEVVASSKGESDYSTAENFSAQTYGALSPDSAKKRFLFPENNSDSVQENFVPAKRIKHGSVSSMPTQNSSAIVSPPQSTCSIGDEDNRPVHQLVAMFGALVAQGKKASGSLDILVSSISPDLLAEVVMVNMRHLPPSRPKAEENEESVFNVDSFTSLLGTLPVLPSDSNSDTLGNSPTQLESLSAPQILTSQQQLDPKDEQRTVIMGEADFSDIGTVESEIPGLESTVDTIDTSQSSFSMPQVSSQDQFRSADLLPIVSALSAQCVLPKILAPVITLTDEEKDHVLELSFLRIVRMYKQIASVGGTQLWFSLLSYLSYEHPLELDSWGHLKKHILSDYQNYQGHELALNILYKLYCEAEQQHDFLLSRNATSVYDSFLLIVAEALCDSFPSSDKSLVRLLVDVPYIPKSVLELLRSLCTGKHMKHDRELLGGDRVTQGLTTLWNLILRRPPTRDACLNIILESAVHDTEEIRMKALRLVANKLYPIQSITQKIEDFGIEMLHSVANNPDSKLDINVGSSIAIEKDSNMEGISCQGTQQINDPKDQHLLGTNQVVAPQKVSCSAGSNAKRCMSLYFALCTKKHSLLKEVFVMYKSMAMIVKQEVHHHIPILVRTIGPSLELLTVISDLPSGSENLLMQVLHALTDGVIPSPDLIVTIKRLYESRIKDVELLIPILPFLSKDEILPIFLKFVELPLDKFQVALACILKGPPGGNAVLSPAEVLIAIHGIDPEKDGIPLKKVTDACSTCFDQKQVFTQQVLAKVLNQLVENIPLPLLFMRTVIQAINVFPALVDFVMDILSRLVNKQIWRYPKLWVGFLKCAVQTKPQSYNVLLQLPAVQLENALNRIPVIKAPLVVHANQPNVRSTLPRSSLVVLGLSQDTLQSSRQSLTAQISSTESNKSGVDATTIENNTKEPSTTN